MLSRLSPRRRRFVAGLALVCAAGIAAVTVAVLPERSRRRDDVPVVLVHGLGGDVSNMTAIEAALRRRGRRTISVALPRNGFTDISASADAVDRAIDSDVVDLVGYSLGGVVVRAWIDAYDGGDRARHVVTLAAPHHGAQLADTVAALDPSSCAEVCAQLRPGSAFLRALNVDETPDGPSYTSIWTALDTTVTPPESSVLDGATNVRLQDVCADSRVGHGSINRDALPVGLTLLALDGDLPEAPGSGLCATARGFGTT